MDIQELLEEKGISRYGLSKSSGIPWATLADICSGKTHLERYTGATLVKLASALEVSVDELLKLDMPKEHKKNGKPKDKSYLESSLPESLDKALKEYLQGESDKVSYLDCLWDELYGAINSNFWGGRITQEQADYLRVTYLFRDEEESDD